MNSESDVHRYVFQTDGVCPPEIHFKTQSGILKEVRFVGGGCPGNAQLVSRLLQGKPVAEVLEVLNGITCRNDTSCPDQFGKALRAAEDGTLGLTSSFQVHTDTKPRKRIGLIGDLEGRHDVLQKLLQHIRQEKADAIYCLGNMSGNSMGNKSLIKLVKKEGVLGIQGKLDRLYAYGEEPSDLPPMDQRDRDFLLGLPHVLSFQINGSKGMGFFGKYVQELPGFSDFDPFALEMNMVCELTDFLRDETVFPALEAMVPQFQTRIILFSQIKKWDHRNINGVDFISIGPASGDEGLAWGLVEGLDKKEINFRIMKAKD